MNQFNSELLNLLTKQQSSAPNSDNLNCDIKNLEQFNLYIEPKDEIKNCEFIQYNVIRIPPKDLIKSQQEESKEFKLLTDNEITKKEDNISIEINYLHQFKENIKPNFIK
ncbi:hypothetical protein ABK040_006804 [Willaertia magna]